MRWGLNPMAHGEMPIRTARPAAVESGARSSPSASFEVEALAHLDGLYRVARRLTRAPADAEDLVQETLLRAWQHPEVAGDAERSARAWLFTVARNAIVDGLRRKPEATVDSPPDVPEPGPGPDEAAESEWVSWRIHRALETLPDKERTLVELAYWSGLSQSEIAAQPGLPLGTVKSRTLLGMRRMRAAMGGWER